MSGFSFGQPASTGTSSGGLFGTSNNNSGGLFGNDTGSGSTGFSFGKTPAATTAGDQKSVFGGATGGSTGFAFGPKPADTTKEAPKSLFGGPVSQPPATPGTSAPPSLFGSTTPAGAQPFSFGNPSTTPAGPPPSSSSSLGASTGGSIFGSNNSGNKGFSFGQPAATTTAASTGASTAAASAPSLFGGNAPAGGMFAPKPAESAPAGGGLFGSKPVDKPADPSSKPAEPQKTPFSFGAPAAAASTSAATTAPSLFSTAPATTTANSGSMFAKPPSSEPASKPAFNFPTVTTQASSSTSPATTNAAVPKSLFSGFGTNTSSTPAAPRLFGGGPPTTSATSPAASTTTTAPVPAVPLFPGLGGPTATSTKPSAPAANAFSFGAPAATAASQPSTTAPAGTQAPSTVASTAFASATTAAPATSTPNLGASTSGPAPPAQSRLRNKTMDEILTRWATDLTRYAKEFKAHADTIAQWDQIIVDNSQKIDKLYVKTRTCEKQTMSVEMQLAAVENQQNELEAWLSKYENDVEEMLAKDGASQSELGGPDQERERTYKLAEKLGDRLDDMSKDLESMVEEVNTANASLSKHTKSDEPITQIVRILNSHLTQLQVIDQGTAQLQTKVTAAQKAANGLGYLNGSANGDARAAVDDFYRSYMGRR